MVLALHGMVLALNDGMAHLNQIRNSPIRPEDRYSELRLNRPFKMTLRIEGRLSLRQRRVIANLLYREISKVFQFFGIAEVHHHDGDVMTWLKEEERGTSLRQACDVSTPHGRTGYEIRMKRLELGITQAGLARLSGLERTHISRIEKGHMKPRSETLLKIARCLKL